MRNTVTANDRIMEWSENLTLPDVFRGLGYHLEAPPVLVRVNGEVIGRSVWKSYRLPSGARIQVLNILRGG